MYYTIKKKKKSTINKLVFTPSLCNQVYILKPVHMFFSLLACAGKSIKIGKSIVSFFDGFSKHPFPINYYPPAIMYTVTSFIGKCATTVVTILLKKELCCVSSSINRINPHFSSIFNYYP
ncbi:hypothetical protein EDC94DRAFT_607835 [Helicostylum pulchrum]|nr:hypothetical protein EDC94DRAFT_607835 [Helicostylum pulchrum]